MQGTNRKNVLLLFFTLVVVMMGFGMVIPLLGFYVDRFGGSGSTMGLLMSVYALMQFFFAPVWGELSDRTGRKRILLIGILGNAISQLLFGLASQIWMLFAARILAGILSSATLPTAMAYIGDSTSEENRSGGMGMLGAAIGIGMVLGPGLGGMLGNDSLSLPFFVASGLSVLALILVTILLPESLPESERQTGGTVRGPKLGLMWRSLFGPIGILLVMAFLLSFGVTHFEGVFSLYALDRYGYDAGRVGVIMMLAGTLSAVIQGGLTGPLSKRFGETAVIRGSLLISAVGFLAMTQARSFTGVIATTLLFLGGNAMLRPAVTALTSRKAVGGQGVAMGLNNSFMSLGRVVGPALAGYLFDITLNLPYFTGAIVMLLGFIISLVWMGHERSPHMQQATDSQPLG